MIFEQKWTGTYLTDGKENEYFPCTVPGNIQYDYARSKGVDVYYSDNCLMFKELEDVFWKYKTELSFDKKDGERVFFVTKGIEYEYDVILNGEKIIHHIGMFTKVEEDITDKLSGNDVLEVMIYPHPKREGADECRDQADQSTKPAVEYGWDWHPRLLISGLWEDCYIETRDEYTICDVKTSYKLNEEMTSADVVFDVKCEADTEIEVVSPDGDCVYKGNATSFTLDNIKLWWCNGQGEPNLYKWTVTSKGDTKTGHIGFKRVRLVMNGGAWKEPSVFPKSRSVPPMTVELNGREIFAKGSNWVNPELFTGLIDEKRYRELLVLVKDANMNMLRCWGGAIMNKEPFFDMCDELGLLVWQEFPLACNNYRGTDEYLKVLEQEANAIIDRIGQHVCLAMWCGGNELFNSWSMMTDQSYALRLLNKLCYEKSREIPFIPTAPVMGMGHGYYLFYDKDTGKTVHEIFRQSNCTAYSEFGNPGITEMKYLKEIIPEDLIDTLMPGTAWEIHHGYNSWDAAGKDSWLCFELISKVFGEQKSLQDYIDCSTIMQCEGLKCIFEEARRQKPACSIALNWCFNEPWITVGGQSIITYPTRPKKAYYDVKNSLKPVLPSARIERFEYDCGDIMRAELFLLNDSPEEASDNIEVYVEIDGKTEFITSWDSGVTPANKNKRGIIVQYEIPETETQLFKLILKGKTGENEYTLYLNKKVSDVSAHALNV